MTTTLGFVYTDTFDGELGPGGTMALMAVLARRAPKQRIRLRAANGGYLEVRADGTSVEKTFAEEDPHEEYEPTVREVGFVGWPSGEAPRLPHLIVPGWDDSWDLHALRQDPLVARLRRVGCTDDGLAALAEPLFDAEDVEREIPQRYTAEDLLQIGIFLELVMVYA